jgi:hypothetical protein
MLNWRSASVLSLRRRYSRYAVSLKDFWRRSFMLVLSKTEREAQRVVRSITEGLEMTKPFAPGMGLNSG